MMGSVQHAMSGEGPQDAGLCLFPLGGTCGLLQQRGSSRCTWGGGGCACLFHGERIFYVCLYPFSSASLLRAFLGAQLHASQPVPSRLLPGLRSQSQDRAARLVGSATPPPLPIGRRGCTGAQWAFTANAAPVSLGCASGSAGSAPEVYSGAEGAAPFWHRLRQPVSGAAPTRERWRPHSHGHVGQGGLVGVAAFTRTCGTAGGTRGLQPCQARS